jgi:hypothetical protein
LVRSQRADIIGTSVSDTTAEIRIVIASVTANSRNSRPTTSLMKSSGISTAISETVSEMMVKPISEAPASAASKTRRWRPSGRPSASAPVRVSGRSCSIARSLASRLSFDTSVAPSFDSSRWREMFSIITIASSTTKPVAIVSAIRLRLLRL